MITLKDINMTFNPVTPDETHALKNINLTINKGDFITVIGSNGAGKSTLYNAIAGTIQPTAGKIMLDTDGSQRDITHDREYRRALYIGRIFQNPLLGTAGKMSLEDNMVIASKKGSLLRTNLSKMRSMGRGAAGIIGMRLDSDDEIIGTDVVVKDPDLFVVTEYGYGKRMGYKSFASKGRGGKGMAYLKITEKNGHAIGIKSVLPKDEIIIASKSGMTIRLLAEEVSEQGRSTVGVRLLTTAENDTVTDFAVLTGDDE